MTENAATFTRSGHAVSRSDTQDVAVSNTVPIVVFVVSRLFLAVMAFLGPRMLTTLKQKNHSLLPHTDPLARVWDWSSPWFRFDAGWYIGVAEHGYHWGSLGQANTNFFPLYPLCIRILQPLTLGSPWIASLLVANLAFLGALIVLWRWAVLRWDRGIGLRCILLLSVFPFGLFFATPYAEPLFLLLAVAALLWTEEGRWPLALCACALATLSRPVGIAVVAALILLALQRRDMRHALLSVLTLIPVGIFVGYLWVAFGHPLAFLTYHSQAWVTPHGGILTTIGSQFHTHLTPFDRIDAALAVIFLASGIAVWRRMGAAYGAYVLIGLGLPLIHGLVSMERYVIVLFPAIALWATWKHRWGQAVFFSLSLLLQAMFTMMFAAGISIF